MRILLLPTRFPVAPGSSYLTTDLADALLDEGHDVQVLLLDWDAEPGGPSEWQTSPSGVPVLRVCPRAVGRRGSILYAASKFVLSARHVGREARRALSIGAFDALVAWMPAIAFAPVLRDSVRAGVPSRQLFIWDFFPDHHAEIGRVPPGPARWLARLWEQSLLRGFTTIFCTMPANADYLRRRFHVRAAQHVRIAPVWTRLDPSSPVDRAAVRAAYALPADAPIAVFGGQLGAGRGIQQLLDAADVAQQSGSPVHFLFVGAGTGAGTIAREALQRPNLSYLEQMPATQFEELLGACDVGMVATVAGVTSYSMPSKTFAYLKAGLPVVLALEPGNQFAAVLEQRRLGISAPFGDAQAFARAVHNLATDQEFRAGLAERIYHCLAEAFDVKRTASAILSAAADRQDISRKPTNPALNAAWAKK